MVRKVTLTLFVEISSGPNACGTASGQVNNSPTTASHLSVTIPPPEQQTRRFGGEGHRARRFPTEEVTN